MSVDRTRAFTPGLTVSSDVALERLRELPLPGEVIVSVGQSVGARQVVARANLPGDLHILKVAERMGILPAEVVQGLRVAKGEPVRSGGVLCEHAGLFGWFRTTFQSPVDGTVELISPETGHVAVRTASKPIEVRAYIGGVVQSVEPGKSVTIAAHGAMVQGIFGVGGEKVGTLRVLPIPVDKVLSRADIPEDCSGKVLVGGLAPSAEVLRCAAERGACGMVVGSVDDRALKDYVGRDIGIALTGDEPVNMTLMVTEGFGMIPMAQRIPELLRPLDGREVSINGATQVRAGAVRPELIAVHLGIQDGASAPNLAASSPGLQVGSRVRLIRVPYFGMWAEVIELPTHMEQIPTGAYARVLRARLNDGTVVTVPRANVELG